MSIRKGYYENGNIKVKYYFENDDLHKINGPAVIKYYENGNVKEEYYYIKGENMDELKYYVMIGNIKSKENN